MEALLMTIGGKLAEGRDAPFDINNSADEICIAQVPHALVPEAVEAARRRSDPMLDIVSQRTAVGSPMIQALPPQGTQFDLGRVQPIAMLNLQSVSPSHRNGGNASYKRRAELKNELQLTWILAN